MPIAPAVSFIGLSFRTYPPAGLHSKDRGEFNHQAAKKHKILTGPFITAILALRSLSFGQRRVIPSPAFAGVNLSPQKRGAGIQKLVF
jgi:hypothetical protein